jgi:hypothetical protein
MTKPTWYGPGLANTGSLAAGLVTPLAAVVGAEEEEDEDFALELHALAITLTATAATTTRKVFRIIGT